MSDDDCLGDRSGKPDPDVEALERTLAAHHWKPRELAAPESPAPPLPAPVSRRAAWTAAFAVAAALLLVFGSTLLVRHRATERRLAAAPTAGDGLLLTAVSGSAQVGATTVYRDDTARVAPGEWIVTAPRGGRATIHLGNSIGTVAMEPATRVRVVSVHPGEQRLALAQGEIRARVTAPPRLFVVETPAATAVDLGCAYSLAVDPDGRGRLEVSSGWVALEREGRSAMVPAGMACELRPHLGPGIPHDPEAPAPWRAALTQFDFEGSGEAAREVAAGARASDAISLWHLLIRTEGALREEVYERLDELSPAPPGVTREGALALRANELDVWRLVIASEGTAR